MSLRRVLTVITKPKQPYMTKLNLNQARNFSIKCPPKIKNIAEELLEKKIKTISQFPDRLTTYASAGMFGGGCLGTIAGGISGVVSEPKVGESRIPNGVEGTLIGGIYLAFTGTSLGVFAAVARTFPMITAVTTAAVAIDNTLNTKSPRPGKV